MEPDSFEEGQPCPTACGCRGVLEYPPVENCSCHLHPPCTACVERVLTCNECGWDEDQVLMGDTGRIDPDALMQILRGNPRRPVR